MFIRFITTGGTIDKVYFDAISQFEVGDSQLKHILGDGLVDFEYDIVALFHKDSLELSEEDRAVSRDNRSSHDCTVGFRDCARFREAHAPMPHRS